MRVCLFRHIRIDDIILCICKKKNTFLNKIFLHIHKVSEDRKAVVRLIHIMRENESIEDVAYIYNVSKENILNYNPYVIGCANEALWVEKGEIINFNEITKKAEHHSYFISDMNLATVYKPESLEDSFVVVDNWARNSKQVFIDGYDVDLHNGELNLPYDYPCINACNINNIVPSFVLSDLHRYTDSAVMNMLLTDLSFKEYKNVLLIAKNETDCTAVEELLPILKGEGFGICFAANCNLLKKIAKFDGFDTVYYMTEKNIIDFNGFVQNMTDLIWLLGNEKPGVLYTPRYVDINKATSKISYLSNKNAVKLMQRRKIDRINFDDDSQLCWVRYTDEDNSVHSLLYEDIRTFYAKALFLKENQVKNICFYACNPYTNILGKIFDIVK